MDELEQKKKQLEEQLTFIANRVSELKQQKVDWDAENQRLSVEVPALKQKFEDFTKKVTELEPVKSSLEARVKELEQNIADVTKQRDEILSQINHAKAEQVAIGEEINKLKDERQALVTDRDGRIKALDERQALLDANFKSVDDWRHELEGKEAYLNKREQILIMQSRSQ